MTEMQFKKKFHDGVGPKYRGAPYPKFDPAGINERNFADELREKWSEVSFEADGNGELAKVTIDWESQEWNHSGCYGLRDEVARCFKHIGYKGEVELFVHDRDGEGEATFLIDVK